LEKNPPQRYQNIDEIKTDLHSSNLISRPDYSIKEKDIDKSKKSRKTLTIGLLVLMMIFIIVVGYILLNMSKGTARVIDSLAVLPLKNLSGDPNQEYFSDGMTEALITELSRIKALKVISRTSVMQFKNTRKSLPEIARQLKVTAVVEGSVLKAGDKVRITAQLIEAESDKHLWAESYERDLHDILSLQKEVAKTIAKQIKITLTPAEKDTLSKETSIDPIAHEAYLKGSHFLNQITIKGARKAIEYFDRVIEIEPEFAPAYTGKAKAYDLIAALGALPSKKGWLLVREWAEKALKIDKNNANAHMLIADVKYLFEWDWPGAEKAFQKSIELNPNNCTAYTWYAFFLSSMGRHREAVSMSQLALELAPLSIAPYPNGIWIYLFAGMDEQAEVLLDKFRELHPHHPLSVNLQAMIYLKKSRYREALQIFQSQLTKEMSPGLKDEVKANIAYIFARIGNIKKSREMLEYLIGRSRTHYVSPFQIALIYMALDENDGAFVWLEKAYNERCNELPQFLKTAPLLDKLRPDPRFQDLLKRMKLDK
jgi:TolB-like protein/Tfp pilus assembly protein PilF